MKICGRRDLNPGIELGRRLNRRDLKEYLSILEVNGLSKDWIYRIERMLLSYLDFMNWKIDKMKTLDFLKKKRKRLDTSSYRKIAYQVRKFLDYLDFEWAKDIKPPPEPDYEAKRVTKEDIVKTIQYFSKNEYFIQLKALILLGASSGLRAGEIYQLKPENIDLENRIVYVIHDPREGKTTKTGKSRISFFNEEAKEALEEYLKFFKHNKKLKQLFSQTHIERQFRKAPLKVRDLRKFFSQ